MDLYDSADRGVIYLAIVVVTFIIAVWMAGAGKVRAAAFLAVAFVILGLVGIAAEELVFS